MCVPYQDTYYKAAGKRCLTQYTICGRTVTFLEDERKTWLFNESDFGNVVSAGLEQKIDKNAH